MPKDKPSQVTLLPAQCRRLAAVAGDTGGAVGLIQDGSMIQVDTGKQKFWIDAKGDTTTFTRKRK